MIETINIVNREVAKILSIEETLIKVVNQFYWKSGVKESIQSGTHTSIRIKNIGTLVTSRTKLNLKITRTIKLIRALRDPNRLFKEKSREDCIGEKIDELRLLLQRRNDIAKAYKTNKDRLNKKYELRKASMG